MRFGCELAARAAILAGLGALLLPVVTVAGRTTVTASKAYGQVEFVGERAATFNWPPLAGGAVLVDVTESGAAPPDAPPAKPAPPAAVPPTPTPPPAPLPSRPVSTVESPPSDPPEIHTPRPAPHLPGGGVPPTGPRHWPFPRQSERPCPARDPRRAAPL